MDRMGKAERSKLMASIKSSDTKPEMRLAAALRVQGIKIRRIYGPEKIDIAVPSSSLAIFVDGCFWHQCPKHSHLPKSNRGYWLPKLKANVRRAKAKDLRLRKNGWSIVHVWEHSLASEASAENQAKHLVAKIQAKHLAGHLAIYMALP